jgi:hypothetical protein
LNITELAVGVVPVEKLTMNAVSLPSTDSMLAPVPAPAPRVTLLGDAVPALVIALHGIVVE